MNVFPRTSGCSVHGCQFFVAKILVTQGDIPLELMQTSLRSRFFLKKPIAPCGRHIKDERKEIKI
jgi:hypothetical protein